MDKKKMKTLAAVMSAIMLLSTLLALFASAFAGSSQETDDHEGHDHAYVQQIVDYI